MARYGKEDDQYTRYLKTVDGRVREGPAPGQTPVAALYS